MTSTERFKIVMDILERNDLSNCSRNHTIFDKLAENDLYNPYMIDKTVKLIRELEEREESNSDRYPEYIMRNLRQRQGLDEFDTSEDERLNRTEPSEAFSEVCQWNGLMGSYDYTIKSWIKDIYGIDLDEQN